MPFDGANFGDRDSLLNKLDQVSSLLRTEDQWCQRQLSTPDGKRCLLGALEAVHARILLSPHIRVVIREVTGRSHCRIERFNDHYRTTHRLVLAVLAKARGNILMGKGVPIRGATVQRRVRAIDVALARLRFLMDRRPCA